ncbi:serine/threonine-protein kinase [Streptomyces sp. NPDC001634]|uniref:serine/threonine-protein kinase n=1 Tax=Streptomyces sp. NPDC001634 TaxID=3154390 RepID=UPI003321CEAE
MEEELSLSARYGRWRNDDALATSERLRQLEIIVLDLLVRTVSPRDLRIIPVDGAPAFAFELEGCDYLVTLSQEQGALSDHTIARTVASAGLTGRPGDTRWVLLAWGTDVSPRDDQVLDGIRAFGVVLDRTHLDAAVAGMRPLTDLVRATFRRRHPYVPLAELVHSEATPAEPAVRDASASVPWHAVRESARGERRDYRLDRFPLADEGQAQVFRAVHKPSGAEVAFKRRKSKGTSGQRRMRREVEIAQHLGRHAHVMPVLDFDPNFEWLVMPMAEATAEDRLNDLQDPTELRRLVDAVTSVLAEAHAADWLHRDIKPSNILFLDGRWTLADWGIVRRPRGQTTGPLTGAEIGTLGFAAPELSVNPHEATAASDIYSLGQVIGWALTRTMPQPNTPLLPPPGGPWYAAVRQATQPDPKHRPQNVAAFLAVLDPKTHALSTSPTARASLLRTGMRDGDRAAAAQLIALAADHPDNYELYLDILVHTPISMLGNPLADNAHQAVTVVRAMAEHVGTERGRKMAEDNFDVHRPIRWLLQVATVSAQKEVWELLDAAADAMFTWLDRWDQAGRWRSRPVHWQDPRCWDYIERWLRKLRGPAATVVAVVLGRHAHSACEFWRLVDKRRVDRNIRSAIDIALAAGN